MLLLYLVGALLFSVNCEETKTCRAFIVAPSLLSWPRLRSLHDRKLKVCVELSTAGKNISESHDVLRLARRSRL